MNHAETHIHADHITGTGKLRELTGCLGIVPANAHADCANRHIQDEEDLELGSIAIEAIATPGHTDSHMAYLVNGELQIGVMLVAMGLEDKSQLEVDEVFKRLFELTCELHD